MTRDEARNCVGRCGTVPKDSSYPMGPKWYGEFTAVAGDGRYVKFEASHLRPRWVGSHLATLHPQAPGALP